MMARDKRCLHYLIVHHSVLVRAHTVRHSVLVCAHIVRHSVLVCAHIPNNEFEVNQEFIKPTHIAKTCVK